MDRFKLNFQSVIRSVDSSATFSLEGDSIVIGASSEDCQHQITDLVPEEFEGFPVIVINLSQEDYES